MNIKRWIARREPHWQALEALLYRLNHQGLHTLTAAELQQLASLYRTVSADLARAQTQRVGDRLTQLLQKLTTQGYHTIYQGQRHQEWAAVRDFFLWGLPAAWQRNQIYIAIATGIFALMATVGWVFAWRDPAFLDLLMPAWLIDQVREEGKLWMGSIILGQEPVASASIMINNLRVCFAAIVGGVTAGVATVYILALNGLLVGAIAALVAQNGLATPFWAFVFPHGALELPAIFMAGGAGLLIARSLIFPGSYTRLDAVKYYSHQAIQLTLGVMGLLIIAGWIEGFFSPSPLVPDPIKYLVGSGLLWGLIRYGQRRKR